MKVYDQTGQTFKRFALQRKEFRTEEKIDNFIAKKQISFMYPLEDGRIYCEDIVECENERYRVKEAPIKGHFGSVVATQDTAALSGMPFQEFVANGSTLSQCVNAALNGTGWTYENVSAENADIRNISESNTNSLKVLEKIAEIFWVEMCLSAKEKKVYLYSKMGKTDNPVRFMKGFNLKTLEIKTDTHDFATRLYPIGKDGLTIADANSGVEYLDNNQHSDAVIAVIWEDSNYTDAASLKSAAEKYLAELSAPKATYTVQIIDMANTLDGYDDFAFGLGDEADVIDPDLNVDTRERIVRIVRYPDAPTKNTVELSNRTMSFSDMQKKLVAAAESVSNISNGNIVIGSKIDKIPTNKIEGLQAAVQDGHPSYTPRSSGLYKITVDGKGHVSSAAAVKKSDITDLGIPSGDTHYQSKNVVAGSASAVIDTTATLANGEVYLINVENGKVTSAHKISGADGVTVTTDTIGNIIIRGPGAGNAAPTLLYSGSIYASALQAWTYAGVTGLSTWQEVRMWVEVGDGQRGWQTFTRGTKQASISAYVSTAYYGCIQVLCDFDNNRIGVYVTSKNGWGLAAIKVTRIEGLVKK